MPRKTSAASELRLLWCSWTPVLIRSAIVAFVNETDAASTDERGADVGVNAGGVNAGGVYAGEVYAGEVYAGEVYAGEVGRSGIKLSHN